MKHFYFFSSSFFSMRFVSIEVVHPYNSTFTAIGWKTITKYQIIGEICEVITGR